jgi:UDP-N-acetylmuramoylalanine--D-glutamate ligase
MSILNHNAAAAFPARDVEPAGAGRPQPGQARHTLIVGLGKTGLSCARFMSAQRLPFTIVDSRRDPPGLEALRRELPDVQSVLGGFDPALFTGADEVVLSPGVSLREPAVVAAIERAIPVIGDVELFTRAARAPVVAITGSNGKSTVTTLVGDMAREAGRDVRVGGNLGTPVLELLGESEPEFYVLELSSFQLQTTHSLRPAAAVILNVSADHFDRHQDMEEYLTAKRRIYRGAGVMVINDDDPLLRGLTEPDRPTLRLTLAAPGPGVYGVSDTAGGPWLARGGERLLAVSDMPLTGMHNVANALAALALGEAMGLPMASMQAVLRRFRGLPHRMQVVAEQNGVQWINDSKGTNVGAASAAVSGLNLTGRVLLIAGGIGKGADFTQLRAALKDKVSVVLVMGQDAALIKRAVEDLAPVIKVADMDEAVARAHDLARPGDAVLLSPACASFDMFKNYEDRGDAFAAAVRRWAS